MKYLALLIFTAWAVSAQQLSFQNVGFMGGVISSVNVSTNAGGGGEPPPDPDPPTMMDPSTNANLTAYWLATDFDGYTNSQNVSAWAARNNTNRKLINTTPANQPVKSTLGGKTVVYYDGSAKALLWSSMNPTTLWGTNAGTVIARVWVESGSPARYPLLHWTAGASALLLLWHPYEGDVYFDWGASDTTGRVTTANPSDLIGEFHTVIYRRGADGSQSIRIDGVTIVGESGKTATLPSTSGTLRLGSIGSSYYFKGGYYALLTFNTFIDDSTADAHGNWLQ